MKLEVTLAPDGGLRLILPSRRTLDVGNTPSALRFIQTILRNAGDKHERRGHIKEFPTQHVIEIWKRQDDEAKVEAAAKLAEAKLEAEKEKFFAKGIDVDALDISL